MMIDEPTFGFSLISIFTLLVPVLLLFGVGLLVYMLARSASSSSQSRPGQIKPQEREQMLRDRSSRLSEERGRILGMVDKGQITADEADRLLDSLERETTMMACPFCAEEIRVEAVKCRHCGSSLLSGGGKVLTRSKDRMISGVCGGLAEYLDMDPNVVRILVVVIALVTSGAPVLIAYLVGAIVIPESSG